MEISREKLNEQYKKEIVLFEQTHKKSGELFRKAHDSMQRGVPMCWMERWAGSYPLFVESAKGAHFQDVDGNDYIDFCLGDTGSMIGHATEPVAKVISEYVKNVGTTFLLPTEDCIWVSEELQRRFGMKYWQYSTSATDANRNALRMAREVTGRQYILIYNWSYHGSVDETVAEIGPDGSVVPKIGSLGPPVHPKLTTRVIEWNDIAALEDALKDRQVAAVLAEPTMSNCGIVHPIPGYLDALRALTKKYGTILIFDETHTISAGPGGCIKAYGLSPDMVVLGKTLAGGIPSGAYGYTEEIAEASVIRDIPKELSDLGGTGGTLAANALTMAAMKVTLSEMLTEKAYERNIKLAARFNEDVQKVIVNLNYRGIRRSSGAGVSTGLRKSLRLMEGKAKARGTSSLTFIPIWRVQTAVY